MARKAREQEFNVKLNIHLKHDPILLRDITRFILLAIELADKEGKEAERIQRDFLESKEDYVVK